MKEISIGEILKNQEKLLSILREKLNELSEDISAIQTQYHGDKGGWREREITRRVNQIKETEQIVDSLEKQIPKKPGNCGVCGNCGTFGVQTKNAYCFNCGQKIDWSS